MNRLGHHLITIALTAAMAVISPGVQAEAPFAFAGTPGQLPKDVVPIEYVLHLAPDIEGRTFQGSQTIEIEVLRATSSIVMNALNLEIDSATLAGRGQPRMRLDAPHIDKERQTLAFALPRRLMPGRYTLSMAWRGVINGTAEGLYADRYPTPGGERLLLATHMEPTYARQLLPCWDEPAFRARFRLSVDLPAGLAAYSNMPATSSQLRPGGLRRTAFASSPTMPSYLLALVAGDLERVSGKVGGTQIGIVTTAGKQPSTDYAMDATRQLLRYFNGYFGTRYPLPKLDQIAIPGGFPGAMENWGAIIYNESRLLVDPKTSPEATRQGVYGIVAHEIAHQWFGNLVTMAWWDNLWLNEGFAEWMGTKATDRFNPQWHVWLRATEGREWAMELDARKTTHPVQQPVANESEAMGAFDRITYEKGGGFLRMLEAYLGEAAFRGGIRAYMARHRYSNTTTADLWAALAKASGKPVAKIAADWTTQPGFPLIEVDARCEAGQRHVRLRQEQFRSNLQEPAEGRIWNVPIQMGKAGAAVGTPVLLQARTAEYVQRGCDGPLSIDPANIGFYRVRYAPPLFEALAAQWPTLPDTTRYKLLADTSALVQAGQAPLENYFGLLQRFGAEPRLALWRQVLNDLELFDRLSMNERSRPLLQRYAVKLIAPRFARLGWDEKAGESVEDRQLRGLLAGALSTYGDAATIEEGRARFARFIAEPASLPPSLVDSVVQIAGRHADQATYDKLKGLAEKALTSEERFRYYRALGEALDPALAAQTLRLAQAAEVPQIVRNRIAGQIARRGHLDAAWAYAREHADALRADASAFQTNTYFPGIVETSVSEAHADELEAFAKARLPAGALVNAERTGDEIRTRARLKARLLPELERVLAERQ